MLAASEPARTAADRLCVRMTCSAPTCLTVSLIGKAIIAATLTRAAFTTLRPPCARSEMAEPHHAPNHIDMSMGRLKRMPDGILSFVSSRNHFRHFGKAMLRHDFFEAIVHLAWGTARYDFLDDGRSSEAHGANGGSEADRRVREIVWAPSRPCEGPVRRQGQEPRYGYSRLEFSWMLKKSASGVLASLRSSTYRSVCLTSSLAAALLDSLFEHSEGVLALIPNGNFWSYFWHLNRPCSSREAYERRVSAHPRHVLMDEASGRSSAPGVSTKARPVDPSAVCRRSLKNLHRRHRLTIHFKHDIAFPDT